MDITIWWRAYGSATSDTRYNVLSDIAESGVFVSLNENPLSPTDRGDTEYTPYVTTLAANIDAGATQIEVADGTDFDNGDRVKIDGETFILGGKSSNVFANCTPGADGTIKRPHTAGAIVSAMHESYVDEDVSWPEGRHVIRYRVVTVVGPDELVAAEALAIRPGQPVTNDFTTLWGVLDGLDGTPLENEQVYIAIADQDNFNPRTAETFHQGRITAMTDEDGYWQLSVPRTLARVGGDNLALNVAGRAHTLNDIPNVDTICYLELI